MSSYSAFENTRRDWRAVATELGFTGWQAKAFAGLASVSSFLSGGQSITERFGDCECLFLKWDASKGETWTPAHDLLFRVRSLKWNAKV
jgi:hypothetical protein